MQRTFRTLRLRLPLVLVVLAALYAVEVGASCAVPASAQAYLQGFAIPFDCLVFIPALF